MSAHRVTVGSKVKWRVRWREHGQNRQKTFGRKSDADAFDDEITRRKQLGPLAVQQLTTKGPTLSDWVADRWGPEHAQDLELKTRVGYDGYWRRMIEPTLGGLHMQEITVGRLREWQATLRRSYSAHAIDKARTVLSSILRHAAESEAIPGNPLGLVRAPKMPPVDAVIPLAPREVELLRRLLDQRSATMVSVLAYTGMRPGELRALRWSDVGKATILVQNGATPSGERKRTKTAKGRRSVRLLPTLAEDLHAWHAYSGGGARDRVFPGSGPDGGMTETAWNSWRGKQWARARKTLRGTVELDRPYDLRHSFASLLLAEGRRIHDVAEQLGHDARLTLSTYGHIVDEWRDRDDKIDIDHEIRQGRAAATRWAPPKIKRQDLGSRQRDVLHRLAGAGAGLRFPEWNDRRGAIGLVDRGLATHLDGRHSNARYQLTDAGHQHAKDLQP